MFKKGSTHVLGLEFVNSKSIEEHLQHLEKICNRLKQFNVTIKINKSKFCKNKIKFLRYIISDLGTMPDEKKFKLFQRFPQPKNLK